MIGALEQPQLKIGVIRLGVAMAAIVAVYAPIFPLLAEEWATFPSLSHGFAVPFISAYLIWTRRSRINLLADTPSWTGLPLLVGGLALYLMGMLGQEWFLARVSFPLTLAGAAVLISGVAATRAMLPGIAYLFFMIPLPYLTLKSLTDASRLFDAGATAAALPWLGVPVLREGFLLHLPNMSLEVADVCSSIPAIASLLALGAVYGFVSPAAPAVRTALLLAAVPFGIASNIVRIIITAAGAYYLGPIAIQNTVHMWNGATVFLMTLGALVLFERALRRLSGSP
jgi:exosortase